MANHMVQATLRIRRDTASNWSTRNPVLDEGEFGIESNTSLIKVGDGVRNWNNLPYLNKLDTDYFKMEQDGTITISDSFAETVGTLEALAGEAIDHLTITDPPVNDTDAANKKYVDDAIAAAHHLKRAIVQQLPNAADADPDILYMVLAQSGDHYEEYMVVNGAWDMVGTTGDGNGGYELPIATEARLGGVKSSLDNDHIKVESNGIMTLNGVPTTKLYVPTGDTLVLYGGSA